MTKLGWIKHQHCRFGVKALVTFKSEKKQAGAELGQALVKLEDVVEVGS